MSERDLSQSNEELESKSESEEVRELDEVTHEPSSKIEETGSVEQAETIESSLKEVVDSGPGSQQAEKLDDAHGELQEPLEELEGELPHQEKLGHQEQLPEGMPGHEGMPGMDDMPGSEYPGMENMPGGKNLPGSDDSPESVLPGDDSSGPGYPGARSPGSDLPGADSLPGSDMPGMSDLLGSDMPDMSDLPSKSGIPGEGEGMPKPPRIYEADGDEDAEHAAEAQRVKEMEEAAADPVAIDYQAALDATVQHMEEVPEILGGTKGAQSDVDEDVGGERTPPDAVEVRPGMIPGEEITDPPNPDMADSGDEMSKPGVLEATTVDPDSGGGRVPVEAVEVRPGMIPGEEITDPPNPDLAGKSSEDTMGAQSGADVQAAGADKEQDRESDQETGKKGNE